jgi:hypothetical protein
VFFCNLREEIFDNLLDVGVSVSFCHAFMLTHYRM